LIAMIKLFIEHRIDVIRRRTIFELKKAEQREHILLGYQIALDHLDNVIRIIRGSTSRVEAKENLFKYFSEQEVTITENGKSRKIEGVKLDGRKYRSQGAPEIEAAGRGTGLGLSYAQIDAILELQLHRLTQLSIDEILKELKSIRELIDELREILASDKKTQASHRQRAARSAQSIWRRSPHSNCRQGGRNQAGRLDCRHGDADYRQPRGVHQAHGGRYVPAPVARRQRPHRRADQRRGFRRVFVHRFGAQLHFAVTSKGRVYWLKVYELPEAAAATRGKAISSLVKFQEDEKTHRARRGAKPGRSGPVCFHGHEKRHREEIRADGIFQPALDRHHRAHSRRQDELIGAKLTDGKKMIFLASTKAKPSFSARRKCARWAAMPVA